jgi:IclR family transcriptional regulator, acetate operon repressor
MNVRSVQRAVAVLEFLAGTERPAALHEISAAIRTPKSTALNIVRTLAATRLLEVDHATKAYRLGSRLGELASRMRRDPDLRALARPHLERLASETGESAFLSVVDGAEIVYVDKVDSRQDIRFAAQVGSRRPLHASAAGKLALATLPPPLLERYLRNGLGRHTRSTITDRRTLLHQIARVRGRGYAEAHGEYVEGVDGIAAPVPGATGELLAIVTIAGPSFRMRDHRPELRRAVRDAAARIAEACGGTSLGAKNGGRRGCE